MRTQQSATLLAQPIPPPAQPWGTTFLDLLRLFSPITWYGLAKNAEKSPFVTIEWERLPQGLVGFLVPLMIVLGTKQLRPTLLSLGRILPCYMVSPWACHCFLASMAKPFVQLGQEGLRQRDFRAAALPEAVSTLAELVAQSQAIRYRRFDMYLPPQVPAIEDGGVSSHIAGKQQKEKYHPKAILFLPGTGVDHISYSPIAAQLAEGGYVVVVPSLEPFRLAQDYLGAEWPSMRRIMIRVQQKLDAKCHWILAGHSAGSFAAMALAYQLHTQERQEQQSNIKRGHALDISSRLVMWASMYLLSYATNLKETAIQLLLIQGDQDALLEMTKDAKDEFEENYLPPVCRQIIIQGGTHGGFASYSSPLVVEQGELSREQQQLQACQETLKFLQGP